MNNQEFRDLRSKSERRTGERTSKLSRKHPSLEALINSTEDLFCVRDTDGGLVTWNRAFGNMIRTLIGVDAYVGMITKDYIKEMAPDFIEHHLKLLARAYKGETVHEEFGFTMPDGETNFFEITYTPIREDNRIIGVGEFNRNITARKLAEEELSAHRKRLIKAQKVAHMGFLDWNLKTDEIVWSREVYDIFGVDPGVPVTLEQTVGMVHSDDSEFVKENLDQAVKGLRDYNIDHRVVRPDGTVVWVQSRADIERDKEGVPLFMFGTVLDITERKKNAEEARRQRAVLARVDRATRMGQLSGSIAHELNQPLTGILSTAQAGEIMIKKGQCEPDEMAEIMAEIAADAKRAGEVIRSLRDLYREQKGEFLPADINAVVDETTQLLRSEFVMQHVALTTECAQSVPMVNGNRIQLQQVLVNLIINGNQAMSGVSQDDRRLHIATGYNANEVKAWVEDCGPGIDADKIDLIFEPLATWKPGGTGMGLAISNSIIEAHGGRMWAENRPEGGARVGFTLPVPKKGQQA